MSDRGSTSIPAISCWDDIPLINSQAQERLGRPTQKPAALLELDQLFAQQSHETDQERRKRLVWKIERKPAEDGARPVIYHNRAATCWHPYVKGLRTMVNSIYNGWRMEDVWLDK